MSVRKKSSWRSVLRVSFLVLSIVLICLSFLTLTGIVVAPETTRDTFYNIKVNVESQVSDVKESVIGVYPTIWLEGSGGVYELDSAARGQFIHLEAYDAVPGIVSTWAAHNNWGGDIILNMEPGQHVNIVGSGLDGEWVVVDRRDIDKFGFVDQGLGLQGEIALQTCLYGVPLMRLTGLVPLDVYETGWATESAQSVDSSIPKVELLGNDS